MNFKEIRLTGFKSFADKTSIRFQDGVTCIVGPNGCGKSNVADAVRWVLGEQSAKTLRGSSMQDVIFNGTETRRQLSYCEVTLVFDNSQKLFDIEYEEVAMTRRLYRNGDSEYLLNMQPCRLKDIVALLHGVGIGKEGYSIIGQGKVDQIMNAKPEDRRAIFEEATGVMAFKAQRGEIERKIESSRGNLTVFMQRMDEVERQLRPLEHQAEQARKFHEYKDKLRYEEVNTYLLRCDNFAYETEKQRERIQAAEEGRAAAETRLATLEEEESAARAQIDEADELLHSLNEELRRYEVSMANKSGDAKVLGERIQAYRARVTSSFDDVSLSLRRVEEIERECEELSQREVEQKRRSEEIERESAELMKKLQEAEIRYAAFERALSEKRANELSTVENLADARVSAGSLTAKRDATQERIDEVRLAIAKAAARRKEYENALEACRAEKRSVEQFLDRAAEEEETLHADIEDLTSSERRISQEIADCNTSVANHTNNLATYQSIKDRFDGYRESVRRLCTAAKTDAELSSRIKGTIAEIVTTDKKYEVAIETAFGGAMQNLVVATREDGKYLIRYLDRNNMGVVTFLPIDGMDARYDSREATQALQERGVLGLAGKLVRFDPYYSNVILNYLGNTVICDTLDNASALAAKYRNAFQIVTLDGSIFSTRGSMTGGSRRRDTGNLLAIDRQIKECEEAIARKKATAEKLQQALLSCQKDLEEARLKGEAFRMKLQEQTARFAALEGQEKATQSLIDEAARDEGERTVLLEQLTRTVDSLESEVRLTAESEDVLSRIREEAAQETSERMKEGEELKEIRDSLSKQLSTLQLEGAALASVRAAGEENVKRLQSEREQLVDRVAQTRGQISRMEEEIEKLKLDEERVALTEEEQKEVAALRERLARTEGEKREVNRRQAELSEEKRKLQISRSRFAEEKHTCEMEITRAESSLENMKQRIQEDHGLDYEGAQAYRDPNYDITQANSTINSLRHKLTALGNVNLRAEEDYNELLSRYTEMQTQREDIEKGILDLTTALTELKGEMQRKFDEGFNEINSNFTKIFKELFGGGRAEMELDYTNCEDPLDAGIEIVACPPGKKLTKISLLSGGERAFTAIAILFAILKNRPMPFCILDEIEAALDEANVGRFAKYLKKFAKETQFIVITHRKPTMNQADTLFGVTMEEKGVSKIVSVKLSEVETELGGDTVV